MSRAGQGGDKLVAVMDYQVKAMKEAAIIKRPLTSGALKGLRRRQDQRHIGKERAASEMPHMKLAKKNTKKYIRMPRREAHPARVQVEEAMGILADSIALFRSPWATPGTDSLRRE